MSGVNTYTYVLQNPVLIFDPTGLWTLNGHYDMTHDAFDQMYTPFDSDDIDDIARHSFDADYIPNTQIPANSSWHCMRDGTSLPRQTVRDAHDAYDFFIDQQLSLCSKTGLGHALHAAQDCAAGGHKGFQPWDGGAPPLGLPSLKHIWNDLRKKGRKQGIKNSQDIIKKYIELCEGGCSDDFTQYKRPDILPRYDNDPDVADDFF